MISRKTFSAATAAIAALTLLFTGVFVGIRIERAAHRQAFHAEQISRTQSQPAPFHGEDERLHAGQPGNADRNK